jgi:hypothetical protein
VVALFSLRAPKLNTAKKSAVQGAYKWEYKTKPKPIVPNCKADAKIAGKNKEFRV